MKAYNLDCAGYKRFSGILECIITVGDPGQGIYDTFVKCEDEIVDGENVTYSLTPGQPWDAIITRCTEDSPKGYIMRVSSSSGFSRDANGYVAYLKSGPTPVVLATSYGENIRRCLWREVIIAAEPGTILQVHYGRNDPNYLIVTENGVFKLSRVQAEFEDYPTLFEDYKKI